MENFFYAEFWEQIFSLLVKWSVTQLPGILIIVIALFVLLRTIKFTLKKFREILLKRAEHHEETDTAEAEKRINTLTGIMYAVLRITVITVFIIILLSQFAIDIAPLLASAGILGLAIGFGAQELVRDYISGFFILMEDQIRTGDVAIINGTGGVVEKIELRTITLRDLSGVVHIYQNGKINSVSNMTKTWSAAVLDIGVAYKEDVGTVIEIMKEVGANLKNDPAFNEIMIDDLEVFGLNEFSDSALIIRGRIKTKPGNQWTAAREYRKRIKEAFDKNSIEIPFPHTTVYWGEEINPLKLNIDEKK
ncbi:mechanosensitive ion channel family protein [Marinilabiliaceae bacterium ANBcel2]|nr:mechanosensitive ion channel family protein [Marinilabiliaceae bacterium ANBcel2]